MVCVLCGIPPSFWLVRDKALCDFAIIRNILRLDGDLKGPYSPCIYLVIPGVHPFYPKLAFLEELGYSRTVEPKGLSILNPVGETFRFNKGADYVELTFGEIPTVNVPGRRSISSI
jgi:hypothetical protein